jgi:hypothetical protein
MYYMLHNIAMYVFGSTLLIYDTGISSVDIFEFALVIQTCIFQARVATLQLCKQVCLYELQP